MTLLDVLWIAVEVVLSMFLIGTLLVLAWAAWTFVQVRWPEAEEPWGPDNYPPSARPWNCPECGRAFPSIFSQPSHYGRYHRAPIGPDDIEP